METNECCLQILYAYEDEVGDDVIASLDFWGRPQSPNEHAYDHDQGQNSFAMSEKF